MAINRISNIGQVVNSLPDQTATNSSLGDAITSLSNFIITARVTDIVLNENHPQFKTVGEYNGIGAIYYEKVNESGTKTTGANFALPYDPQLKTYPLINEYVILINIPNNQTGGLSASTSYFYLNPVNIWNHPHHDAYPNPLPNNDGNIPINQSDDYAALGEVSGSVRRVGDDNEYFPDSELNSKENTSQFTFVEKADIHPLMPFMGDVLLEGRHGQSVRFGSTARPPLNSKPLSINNNWSSIGTNGDPITILRNGQPSNSTDEGWIPITENISNDLSSIYLTSYQQLNTFKVASELYQSYKTPPTFPSQYKNPQVILNSDRIVINAKTDSVLLSAQQSIGMSTNGSVNIDATSHYISSNDIRLGSKNATQPVLLGNDTIEVLKQLANAVKDLASILQVQRDYPNGALVTSYNSVADNVLTQINSANGILAQLNDNSLKSKTTKVQ
jgi:hypothetical protein